MKKLVPDPPASELLQLDPPNLLFQDLPSIEECEQLLIALIHTVNHTTTVLIDSGPGLTRDAMGMNIRLLCRAIHALSNHTSTRILEQCHER
ncbi:MULTISPECIES: hypothetical protein [Pseudomonas]|uniref:Uncharacterized protein n=1 Tax=Pseudomonas juntendi TaxID=2666183 RepID=A0A7W2KJ49_9PSED|nr:MULTISPECIES: hypothetical protein [Pseudomonas]MBA6099436.1 hypothetical protein [Pseudomonas juntendi]